MEYSKVKIHEGFLYINDKKIDYATRAIVDYKPGSKGIAEVMLKFDAKVDVEGTAEMKKEIDNMADTFDFGEAIKYLKRGLKVARKGWNGKKQYIELANAISYLNADGETINCNHDAIGNKAIAFIGTSGVQMGWLASQADMLAEDWTFVE